MKPIIKRSIGVISTCPRMHDHGQARIRFSYSTDNPLVFQVHTQVVTAENGIEQKLFKLDQEIYREVVFYWLVDAPGGSLLTLGETSLKVRLSTPAVVVFKFADVDLDGEIATPMFMMNRSDLHKFLADTYAAIPVENECDYLKIDDCIEKILSAGTN